MIFFLSTYRGFLLPAEGHIAAAAAAAFRCGAHARGTLLADSCLQLITHLLLALIAVLPLLDGRATFFTRVKELHIARKKPSFPDHSTDDRLLYTCCLNNLWDLTLRMVTHVVDDLLLQLLFLLAAVRADAGVID